MISCTSTVAAMNCLYGLWHVVLYCDQRELLYLKSNTVNIMENNLNTLTLNIDGFTQKLIIEKVTSRVYNNY